MSPPPPPLQRGPKLHVLTPRLQQVGQPAALGSQERAYFELASGFVCASRGLLIARDELTEARMVLDQAAARPARPAIAERIQVLRRELPLAE